MLCLKAAHRNWPQASIYPQKWTFCSDSSSTSRSLWAIYQKFLFKCIKQAFQNYSSLITVHSYNRDHQSKIYAPWWYLDTNNCRLHDMVKHSRLIASEWIVVGYTLLYGASSGNTLFYVYINIAQKEAVNEFKIWTLTEIIKQLSRIRVIYVSCVSDLIFDTSPKCPFGSQKMKRTSQWIAVTVPNEIQFR